MSPNLEISESSRDEELALIKKRVRVSSSFSFETPNRSMKEYGGTSFDSPIHETTVKITEENLQNIIEGKSQRRLDNIKKTHLRDKLNLTIFNVTVNDFPTQSRLRALTHYMHEASINTFVLPSVKSGLLQDKIPKVSKKTGKPYLRYKFNEDKFDAYLNMMKFIIEEAEIWNNKEIIGTVPLLAPKYSDKVIELYNSHGIQSFVMDFNLSQLLSTSNLAHLKTIISKIIEDDRSTLGNKLIYACNLGISQFENMFSRADDFLSIFAYIDVFGNTFKTRGFKPDKTKPPPLPRAKLFSREDYGYNLFGTYKQASRQFGFNINRTYAKNHDQYRQYEETLEIKGKIGTESVIDHISPKKSIDDTIQDRLKTVVSDINPQ
jgi:hypothetical protein